MALVKVPDKSMEVATLNANHNVPKEKKKILDEDTYTEEMENIITRDFFPHVKKLKAQNEYLEALEIGDMAKIQEIQALYKPKALLQASASSSLRIQLSTPSTFETPDVFIPGTPFESATDDERDTEKSTPDVRGYSSKSDVSIVQGNKKKQKSLDQFLAQTTSEDNASFDEIMVKNSMEHMQKYPWLYKDEEAEQTKINEQLALPSAEQIALESTEKKELLMWGYKNKNALMYVPDGVDFTVKEKIQFEKRQSIQYDNTRFSAPPFDEQANKAAIAEAASIQAKMKEGRVGIDGKEIIGDESPKVNGYGFVGPPSPNPGVTSTPIMTWGEIEGTPFRLDGGDTPLLQNPGGQQFKMPDIPARERIAHSLADKAARKKRQKKSDALKHAQSSWLTPSPKFGSSSPLTPTERLNSMSPAAQKLMCSKFGIHRNTDKALRATYTPSPLRSPFPDKTPELTSPFVDSTPELTSPLVKTPELIRNTKVTVSAKSLRQFPKRLKAKDFF